jgi:hypothetical protein
MDQHFFDPLKTKRQLIVPLILIAATFFVARYLHSGTFGFYEDDYTLVVPAMSSTLSEVWEFVSEVLFQSGGQGRPLQHSLIIILAHVTGKLGGLGPSYVLGYLIVTANCILFYFLLRMVVDHNVALIGALAYVLYSADTTQAFIYHALGLQQSLTFFLLASMAYLSGKKLISYVLILGSLLSYETTYLVFLAVPLLRGAWNKNKARELFLHTFVVLAIFSSVVFFRYTAEEGRISALGFPEILLNPLMHMIQGPLVSFGAFFYRPIQVLQNLTLEHIIVVIISFAVFSYIFVRMRFEVGDDFARFVERLRYMQRPTFIARVRVILDYKSWPNHLRESARFIIVGVMMLILAYPLTFTIRAYAISGRDTRVHFGAILGASILWMGIWYGILFFSAAYRWRRVPLLILAGMYALLLGFGITLQSDYQRSWKLQQKFWSSLVAYVPDLEDGTVILVDPAGLEDTKYLDANTWNLPVILQHIYVFPEGWEDVPRAHRLLEDWRERSLWNSREIKAIDFKWEYVVAPWGNVILLETEDGRVVNRVETITIDGVEYAIKPFDVGLPADYTEGFIYKDLILSDSKK